MAWDDPGGSGQARSRRGTFADPAGANPLKSIDCALMDGYRRLRMIRRRLSGVVRELRKTLTFVRNYCGRLNRPTLAHAMPRSTTEIDVF
jgi:hypothetical protein